MRVWSHRRLSPEESGVVGIVGEMHAYRFLRKEFGGRAVHASAWVSESRLKVLPLVEGERDKTSDGHGFNFRFNHNGVRWHVEVKATKGGGAVLRSGHQRDRSSDPYHKAPWQHLAMADIKGSKRAFKKPGD